MFTSRSITLLLPLYVYGLLMLFTVPQTPCNLLFEPTFCGTFTLIAGDSISRIHRQLRFNDKFRAVVRL